MHAKRLSNGNMLVPGYINIGGRVVFGMKEVAPGSPDYTEWAGSGDDQVARTPEHA